MAFQSIKDEYDAQGNYIGDSPSGNAFHGVEPAMKARVLICAACDSGARRPHGGGGSTVCAACGCAEAKWSYR